jgi:hypothetical protein
MFAEFTALDAAMTGQIETDRANMPGPFQYVAALERGKEAGILLLKPAVEGLYAGFFHLGHHFLQLRPND